MKLFYYKTQRPTANFGDELNPWLWPRLIPAFKDSESAASESTVFVGIGTILNNTMPQWLQTAKRLVFFSTGFGYGRQFRLHKQANWQIYCVRGPLSAKRLKLPASLAITDGAALLKRFLPPVPTAKREYKVAYIPHFRHGSPALFKRVCEQANIHFIDPAAPVEEVISQIGHSQLVISEAMHGAIVADTLRVPWIPVRTSPKILPFKWWDWCASMEVPYRYQMIKGVRRLTRADHRYQLRPVAQRQARWWHLLDGLRMDDWYARRKGTRKGQGTASDDEVAIARL
ncbi:MAG: polysaccharide pyruvyl transferase family protein, partial [Cyanobacteria bacterium J06554_3]